MSKTITLTVSAEIANQLEQLRKAMSADTIEHAASVAVATGLESLEELLEQQTDSVRRIA